MGMSTLECNLLSANMYVCACVCVRFSRYMHHSKDYSISLPSACVKRAVLIKNTHKNILYLYIEVEAPRVFFFCLDVIIEFR